jgi:hypothetical protein
VAVFPIPGGRVASPQTQITFRGVPASALGQVSVSGSRSGAHLGLIAADSDGQGGSFIPAQPFLPGETVTVATSLNVLGSAGGTFHFTVANPADPIAYQGWQRAKRVPGDVWQFHSRPDLSPAAVTVRRTGQAIGTDIFLSPQFGPVQNGPEILDPNGNLVWFAPVPSGYTAANLRVQLYGGQPVLTWWQGYTAAGIGVGENEIYDSSYRPVTAVSAGNGLSADLHEFDITPQNTALISAYYPVHWDARSVGGRGNQIVFDSVVQVIDIPTGLVLFQWDSLDHVPLSVSYQPLPQEGPKVGFRNPYDYFHINAVQLDADGNLLISARNTWAAYKVDRRTGAVRWTLGGKASSFRMGPGASFAFEHDVRAQGPGDRFLTMFDDGAGQPAVHSQSRGLELRLDFRRRTARLYRQWGHSPPLLSEFEGSVQQLSHLNELIGWGQQPYFSEFSRRGRTLLDGRFVSNTASYRVYTGSWSATPAAPPAVAAVAAGGAMTVYASWDGATNVASWTVLTGSAPTGLAAAGGARKSGFETAIQVPLAAYVAVQAVDAGGRVLGISPTVSAG